MPNFFPTSPLCWLKHTELMSMLSMCSISFWLSCFDLSTFLLILCLFILGTQYVSWGHSLCSTVLRVHYGSSYLGPCDKGSINICLPCPWIKANSADFLPHGISDNCSFVRAGVNKRERNICVILTLTSHLELKQMILCIQTLLYLGSSRQYKDLFTCLWLRNI